MKTKTDHVAVNRSRIAAMRGWIAARREQKRSADLARKAGAVLCVKATGLTLSQVTDAARAIGARF